MNGKEKRLMEKKLGLLKVKKELRLEAWSEEVSKNIEYGKNKQNDMKELRRLQEQEAQDRLDAIQISYMVDELTAKGMELSEAQEKAKEMYSSKLNK